VNEKPEHWIARKLSASVAKTNSHHCRLSFKRKVRARNELIATRRKLHPVFLTRGAVTLARTVRYPWIMLASLSHCISLPLPRESRKLRNFPEIFILLEKKNNRENHLVLLSVLANLAIVNVNECAIITKIHCENELEKKCNIFMRYLHIGFLNGYFHIFFTINNWLKFKWIFMHILQKDHQDI